MEATVFLKRDRGIKLPAPRRGVSGDLVLEPWRDGDYKAARAELRRSAQDAQLLLPYLYGATLRRISTNGLVLSGFEVIPRRGNNKASADRYPQVWWCLIHTVPLAGSMGLELENYWDETARLERSATGF